MTFDRVAVLAHPMRGLAASAFDKVAESVTMSGLVRGASTNNGVGDCPTYEKGSPYS